MAAVTNSHKLGGLKQQEFILSQLWRSEVQYQHHLGRKPGVGRAVLPPEALGENLFLSSSSLWGPQALLDLWLHHPHLCLCGHIAFSSSVCVKFPPPHSYKNTWAFRPTQIMQGNLSISQFLIIFTKSLQYRVTFTGSKN